jgi:hypothetical protein
MSVVELIHVPNVPDADHECAKQTRTGFLIFLRIGRVAELRFTILSVIRGGRRGLLIRLEFEIVSGAR